MWTLDPHHDMSLAVLTLYDNHRLNITPPADPERTAISAAAARHLVPGTTATFLVTSALITPAGAVFYTPDHVPVASWPAVTLPTLPPGQEPDQRLDAPQDHLTRVIGTVIAQAMDGLAQARRSQERYVRLVTPATATAATTTPAGVRVTNNRRGGGRKDT